jgi:crotonobetainyl-CoA:carnitine CoA-transferase CaiB-like acyl-CoA transferase
MSKTDWKMRSGGPCVGEHTDAVLSELLGLSRNELDELREEGVI